MFNKPHFRAVLMGVMTLLPASMLFAQNAYPVTGEIKSDQTNNVAFSTKSTLGVNIQQMNYQNDVVNSNNYYSIFAHNTWHNGNNWIRRNPYSGTWATVMNNMNYSIYYAPAGTDNVFESVVNPVSYLCILPSGNVLIGKTAQANVGYKLDVAGVARVDKMVVNTTGADYVFDASYRLRPLAEVNAYIRKNHHLPEVASAGEMQEKGLDVGDNQTVLLKKIEELTLYVIEEQRQLKAQAIKMDHLQRELRSLKAAHKK